MNHKDRQVFNAIREYTQIFKALNPADTYANSIHQEASHYAHMIIEDLIRKHLAGLDVTQEIESLKENYENFCSKSREHSLKQTKNYGDLLSELIKK